MSLVYRPAHAQDLARAEELVVASINDLTERHGFGPMVTASPPHFQMFSLKDDPGGLWVAEDGGDILGFAWSWVCGDVWFLAQLFVDPNQQGRGIENELIKLTLEHARKSVAFSRRYRHVWSASRLALRHANGRANGRCFKTSVPCQTVT